MNGPGSLLMCAVLSLATAGWASTAPSVRAGQEKGDNDAGAAERGLALMRAAAEAMGGADRLETVKSVRVKGTVALTGPMGEMKGDSVAEVLYPDRIRSVVHLPMGQVVQAFDGTTAWVRMGNGQVQEMPSAMHQEMRRSIVTSAGIGIVRRALDGTAAVVALDPEEVSGRRTDVVAWTEGGQEIRVSLDADTHLMAKLAYDATMPQGLARVEILAGDYRDTDGIRIPWQVTGLQDGQQYLSFQATEITINPEIDPASFSKP